MIKFIHSFQSMLVTISEQCEKKLLALKQEEKSGKAIMTKQLISTFRTFVIALNTTQCLLSLFISCDIVLSTGISFLYLFCFLKPFGLLQLLLKT